MASKKKADAAPEFGGVLTVEMPDYVTLRGKLTSKKFHLNLNEYRNAHYMILNKAKIQFAEDLRLSLLDKTIPFAREVRVSYRITPSDGRRFDTMNIIGVFDKFFLDALVGLGMIKDDNYKQVRYGEIKVSEVDKSAPCRRISAAVEYWS